LCQKNKGRTAKRPFLCPDSLRLPLAISGLGLVVQRREADILSGLQLFQILVPGFLQPLIQAEVLKNYIKQPVMVFGGWFLS